jgi:ABC-type branched-subunit amino acid transport system substrate-binding protein
VAALSRLVRVVWLVLLLALVACAGSTAAAQHSGKKRKRIVHRSNAAEVVVPRGQPLQIAFVNDSGSGFSTSLANAVQMAVEGHPSVRGFPIEINPVNAQTCGNPANAGAVATAAASSVTANLQNVAVLGQVCSFGFAQALAIYEQAGVVTISGSATNPTLPSAAPTVFDRTTVDDNGFDLWYATVATLPSDVAWRQAYSQEFGSAPADFADLYYDAAGLLIRELDRVSRIDGGHNLVISRDDLAAAVRSTTSYRGVSCTIAIDASTGNRIDDPVALSRCAADTG